MKEIKEIIEKASLINKLKQSEEELFKYINSYPDTVDLVFDKYSISDKFDPVNCLRFLLANEIKKGNTISSDLIKQIIGSLEKKDISNYYNVSDEFQKSLNNKNLSKRSWYASWKEFSILFPFIVSDNELVEVNKKCAVILTKIIKDLKLENVKTHIVDFLGPQNFGADASWCAIIPKEAPDVQSAHQIFFQIRSTGIEGGLYKGDKVSENDYLHKDRIEYDTIEEYIKDISQELHIWKDLNDSIDFELTKNKRSFISSLKTNSDESNRLFFNIIDNVIADLNIEDKQNIVFSTTKKRLVFHVGKRYCFRLKNNKFGFITESDYKINNLENKPFSADAGLAANFYSKAEKNDVTLHYSAISRAINAEILRDNSTQEKEYDNKVFRKVVFDKEFRVEFLNTEENQALLENLDDKKQINMNSKNPKNQILFGPPGTGKTFNTINKAIQIVDPEFYQNNHSNRDELKKRFNELLITDFDSMDGRIVFTTFHQSMSYEDFVEGIKPVVVNENITYNVSDGIFKKICEIAGYKHSVESEGTEGMLNWSSKQYNDSNFYKMSLGDTLDTEDSDIYSYCIKNNCISLGFGATSDFSGLNKEDIHKQVKENSHQLFAADALNRLINKMSIGDYVIISKGNLYARALGKITSDYFYDDNTEIEHNHYRNVEWILTDENIHVSEFLNKRFSQQSIYHIDKSYLKEEYFKGNDKLSSNDKKSYALIIDEINRGNVSSIFGDLITLIEEDKRKGNAEELSVTLPYSKQPFSVPNNLHIIGTMNTADRSVEALDSALRRRFDFEEMLPKPELLKEIECEGGIDLTKMLIAINTRIEKLIDKDSQIGHSYFMSSESKLSLIELKKIFKNKVIPLLQEYFYGDFAKIGLILGDEFVIKDSAEKVFSNFTYEDIDIVEERVIYNFANVDNLSADNFKSIY